MAERPRSSNADLVNLILNVGQSSALAGLDAKLEKLHESQNQLIASQNQIIELKSQLNQLIAENAEFQRQSLIQQQIQTNIQIQEDLYRKKQRELKNAAFAVMDSVRKADSYRDPVAAIFYLDLIQKQMDENAINPQEFEEIADKEYANSLVAAIENKRTLFNDKLTAQAKKDLDYLYDSLEVNLQQAREELEKEIAEINRRQMLLDNLALKIDKLKIELTYWDSPKAKEDWYKKQMRQVSTAIILVALVAFPLSFYLDAKTGARNTWIFFTIEIFAILGLLGGMFMATTDIVADALCRRRGMKSYRFVGLCRRKRQSIEDLIKNVNIEIEGNKEAKKNMLEDIDMRRTQIDRRARGNTELLKRHPELHSLLQLVQHSD